MSGFWSLPGPHRFVEQVTSQARAGNCVIIALPEFHPAFLATAIRKSLAEDYTWQQIVCESGVRPTEALFNYCLPELDPKVLRTVRNLIRESDFWGRAIWITGVQLVGIADWCEFLMEFAHLTRSAPRIQQSVVLLPLVGQAVNGTLPEDAGLFSVRWHGWMDRLDITICAATQARDQITGLEKHLTIALASELGGPDPELISFLARLELSELLEPDDYLRSFAAERKWSLDNNMKQWWTGKTYELEGRQFEHAALLAVENRSDELRKAIWKAEVGALFPIIEFYRQHYIRKYQKLLAPFESPYEFYDVRNLEIGMIRWQLSRCPKIDTDDLLMITDLKNARNALAHLRPVDPSTVLRLCRNANAQKITGSGQLTQTDASTSTSNRYNF